ncbi:hypothetical protein Pla110_09280 [Polystyrenella longa]|uniref:Knr4/Smi1-like domain-containing protein n=1 Tax=Polystyrenella longa TaxID=2528007 RepID=A0A518CJ16_9PLAN|nr:SMI1/KNR4 family protein [Polystyrenella longa]QDU79222.1 hypothetical protein Pla110_09280 [Polystyrenella longa]
MSRQITEYRNTLQRFYVHRSQLGLNFGVASKEANRFGVPPEMQAGPINSDGWVEWKLADSTARIRDIRTLEEDFQFVFPESFINYLQAMCHLFDDVSSRKYDQQIFWEPLPLTNPLGSLRFLIAAWDDLIRADFIPVAQWGDGWGPICFDAKNKSEPEHPLVWFDHEYLARFKPHEMQNHAVIAHYAQPIYDNFNEMFDDLFGSDTST